MFIDRELAKAMAEGRKRFLSVYEGRTVLFMPYGGETHRYVCTHYVPELARSVICEGEAQCRFHHLKEVAKCHVPALVFRKALPYSSRECTSLPKTGTFDAAAWTPKIVELTESCIHAFEVPHPEGTLATIARKPGKRNGEVEFRWLESVMHDYPSQPMNVEELLPAVIRGTFYPTAAVLDLDKDRFGRTKHKI